MYADIYSMRLFTGIKLPDTVCNSLERLLLHLRPTAHLRWSPVYNLHVTTKFIGEWTQPRLEELKSGLRSVPQRGPIPISISGLGWFPNPHHPRVFWAGVHGGEALRQLAADIDQAMEPLGIEREKRAYSPHLTLARVPDGAVPLQALRQAIARIESAEFGTFEANSFFLYLSKPGAAGSVYTKLEEFGFVG
jgi:2'-5' RNA ligase